EPEEHALREGARTLHRLHQRALAALLRGEPPRPALTTLAQVAARMGQWTEGPQQLLWHAAVALCEALLVEALEPDVTIELILRRLGPLLAGVAEEGPPALRQPPPAALLHSLLFVLATSG